MALLASVQLEMRLSLRLLGKSFDPFQADLEWFEYELSIEGGAPPVGAPGAAVVETRTATGRMNRKGFNELLRALDMLVGSGVPLRFEPADLNFYFEWSHETPLVYLILTWFDLAFSPRRLDQRFPAAHAGYRFLSDRDSLLAFREALEEEFLSAVPRRKSAVHIN